MTTNTRSAAGPGLPKLTRRAALAGLALAVTPVAGIASEAVAPADAELLALLEELRACRARLPSVEKAFHASEEAGISEDAVERAQAAWSAEISLHDGILARAADIPAASFGGLVAKAEMLANEDAQAPTWQGTELTQSLLADLRKLGAGSEVRS